MRWYSVKKHKPPIETLCFVYTNNNYVYAARLIDGFSLDIWAPNTTCEDCICSIEKISGVTHFCIPDPVEIEK